MVTGADFVNALGLVFASRMPFFSGQQEKRKSPHLCFDVGQFPCLLGSLTQQVCANFNHCCCVVVYSCLLELDHILLHAVLYVGL